MNHCSRPLRNIKESVSYWQLMSGMKLTCVSFDPALLYLSCWAQNMVCQLFTLHICGSQLFFHIAFFQLQAVWCPWGKFEPFSATLAQNGLPECNEQGITPLKYRRNSWGLKPGHGEHMQTVRYWDYWPFVTPAKEKADSEIHSFSH